MASPDFLPSDEDVLRARSVTTGVVTSGFKVEDATAQGLIGHSLENNWKRTSPKKTSRKAVTVTVIGNSKQQTVTFVYKESV